MNIMFESPEIEFEFSASKSRVEIKVVEGIVTFLIVHENWSEEKDQLNFKRNLMNYSLEFLLH